MSIEIISSLIGIVTGLFGVMFAILSKKEDKIKISKEFFESTDSIDFRHSRKQLYDKLETSKDIDVLDEDLRKYISHYEFWGLMLKKNYLPFWVFEGMAGKKVLQSLEKIKEYGLIEKFDNTNGNFRPENFIYLYDKLSSKIKIE